MFKEKLFNCLPLHILIMSLFLFSGCDILMKREIPITTSSSEALTYFIQGRELYENLRTQESIEYFKKSLEKDPNFAMAYYYLAEAYRFTGSSTGFYRNLEKAVALVDKYLAFAHPYIGDTKDFYGNLRKAVSLVDKVSEGEKLLILAIDASVKGDLEKEKELYKKLIELYPYDKRAKLNLGYFYFNMRNYKEAIRYLDEAVKIDKEFAPAYNLIGYSYKFLGMYKKAEKALREYARLIPDEANPYDSLAELLMKMGKFDKSIETYRKSISLNPTFYYSYHGLGTNYILKNMQEKARRIFEKFRSIAVSDVEQRQALFLTACSYIDEREFDKALVTFSIRYDIAASSKDYTEMHRDLGMIGDILLESGDYEKAEDKFIEAYEILVKSDVPDNIKKEAKRSLLYNKAQIALKRGNHNEVDSYLKEFSEFAGEEITPREMEMYRRLLGIKAYKEKKYEKAVLELKNADQNHPITLYWLAKSYRETGDIDNAIIFMDRAANFNESNFNYWFIRRKAKRELDKLQ